MRAKIHEIAPGSPIHPHLNITDVGLDCKADGSTKVKCWCTCYSVADIVDVIAWLENAKMMMERWEEIRAGAINDAEASHGNDDHLDGSQDRDTG